LEFFGAYNFGVMVFLMFFGTAINLMIMRQYGINYIYLLNIVSYSSLNYRQIINFGLVVFTYWCVCLTLTYISLNYGVTPFYIYPISVLVVSLLILIWPFQNFYYAYRYQIFVSTLKCLLPFGNVFRLTL